MSYPPKLLATAGALADRILRNALLALRLSRLAVDTPEAAHPALDLVSQAVLFEGAEKRERMTSLLHR